ncbi:MAG: tetratricopeptide repeat protein, partial [Bacteroidota bacterium]
MRSNFRNRFWVVLAVLAALAAVLILSLQQQPFQSRFAHARQLVEQWNIIEAEEDLASLAENRPNDPSVLSVYAEVLLLRGHLTRARDALSRLADLDSARRRDHLISLALVHFYLGSVDTALALLDALSGRPVTHSDSIALARINHLRGLIAFSTAQYQEARKHQAASLHLARTLGERLVEADALRQLGVLAWYGGNPDSALSKYYQRAIEIYKEIGHKMGEATVLSNIGLLHQDRGDISQNLRYQLGALEIRKRIGDQIGLADSYYFLGSVCWQLMKGESSSFAYIEKSLDLSTAIGYSWGREVAARAVTLILRDSPEFVSHLDAYQDSVITLSGEGRIYLTWARAMKDAQNDNWKEAASLFHDVLSWCDSIGYRTPIPHILPEYAQALFHLDSMAAAEQTLLRAQQMTAPRQRRAWLWRIDTDLARLYLATNRHTQAAALLHDVSSSLDSLYLHTIMGRSLGFERAVSSVRHSRSQVYQLLVESLPYSQTDEVFTAVEKERSLPFWGDLGSSSFAREAISRAAALLEQYTERPDASGDIQRIQAAIGDVLMEQMNNDSVSLQAARTGLRDTIAALHEVQSVLNTQEVVLEYFVAEQKVYVVTVRNDTAAVFTLNISAADLKTVVDTYRELLLRGKDMPGDTLWKSSARLLSCELIEPLRTRGFLKRNDHILIAPHQVTHLIPFGALPVCVPDSSEKFLLEESMVSYVPSGSFLVKSRRTPRRTASSIVAMASGELKYADEEVQSIPVSTFRQATILQDGDLGPDKILQEMSSYDLIHIAAHARLNLM